MSTPTKGVTVDDRNRAQRRHPEQRLVDVEEAARILSLGRTHVFALIAAGTLRSVKSGRRRLVPLTAIDEYVDRLVEQTMA